MRNQTIVLSEETLPCGMPVKTCALLYDLSHGILKNSGQIINIYWLFAVF